jgi:hypothetical protein
MPCVRGVRPVRIDACAGSVIGACENAWEYRTPDEDRRSSVGVSPRAAPYAPSRSRRRVSIVTSSTLPPRRLPGCSSGAGAGRAQPAAIATASATMPTGSLITTRS